MKVVQVFESLDSRIFGKNCGISLTWEETAHVEDGEMILAIFNEGVVLEGVLSRTNFPTGRNPAQYLEIGFPLD